MEGKQESIIVTESQSATSCGCQLVEWFPVHLYLLPIFENALYDPICDWILCELCDFDNPCTDGFTQYTRDLFFLVLSFTWQRFEGACDTIVLMASQALLRRRLEC